MVHAYFPNIRWKLFNFGLLFFIIGCVPKDFNKSSKQDITKIEEQDFFRIHDIADRGSADSLSQLLADKDISIRILASKLLGNLKEKSTLPNLLKALNDDNVDVRENAAYAIGQIGDPSAEEALIKSFVSNDSTGAYKHMNATILEAIGKLGSLESLNNMARVSSYGSGEKELIKGLAYGIYRMGLRDKISSQGTLKMLEILSDKNQEKEARLIASCYLQRVKNLRLDSLTLKIIPLFEQENDKEIKSFLAAAVGKTRTKVGLVSLINQLNLDSDWRVKCQIIKGFSNFELNAVFPIIAKYLKDPNEHVANAASQFCIDFGNIMTGGKCWAAAFDTTTQMQPIIKANLLLAANKWVPNQNIKGKLLLNESVISKYNTETSKEVKATYLRALGYFPGNVDFLLSETKRIKDPVIVQGGLEAIKLLSTSPDLLKFYRGDILNIKKRIFDFTIEMLNSKDVAKIIFASEQIRNPSTGYAKMLGDSISLDKVLALCNKTEDLEAKYSLQETMASLAGSSKFNQTRPKYNHPISWELYKSIPDTALIEISTAKGKIIVAIYKHEAPGTVVNFVDLVQKRYYDNKTFHRVVPNFVIQGGCSRGDGFGTLDYTIRSEFNIKHWDKSGLIGMASLGNDTESQQFFITHIATPHLDGNYTIFGKVIKGMDIVDQIKIGSIIEKVELLK